MSIELHKKEIEGSVYEFEQMGAKQSTKLMVRILGIIGEPAGLVFGAGFSHKKGEGKSLLDVELKPEFFSMVIKAFTDRADEDKVVELIQILTGSEKVLCDGKKINFDRHYKARHFHMFKVLAAALEVQYGNFLDVLSEFLAAKNPPPTSPVPLT